MTHETVQRAPERPAAQATLRLEQFLPYRLTVCASLVSQALSSVYAERYQIGAPEWRVLVTLGQFGMMTAKAIGLHSHMHKTKVSREVFLSLTPAGREVYDDLAPMALDFAQRLLDTVDPADREALDRALTKLTQRSAELVNALANRGAAR